MPLTPTGAAHICAHRSFLCQPDPAMGKDSFLSHTQKRVNMKQRNGALSGISLQTVFPYTRMHAHAHMHTGAVVVYGAGTVILMGVCVTVLNAQKR